MLQELTIENVAVIEKAVVPFHAGFNVLTGETGAGKSILIDSINAILGNRTSRDIVRNGTDKARIWAVFTEIPAAVEQLLGEAGYECESSELLLYREITVDGKSSCRINSKPASAAYLREISEKLISIHGQHDNQSLLDASKHLSLLDSYAKNRPVYEEYYRQYRALVSVEKELKSLVTDEREKQARIELLRYQIQEIEAAELTPGEEETLAAMRSRLQHAQKITAALNTALVALEGDPEEGGGAVDQLENACDSIREASGYYTLLEEKSAKLQDAFYTVQELTGEVRDALEEMEMDPAEQEKISERLDLFYRLKQKYGSTADEILAFGENARQELEKIEFADEYLQKMQDKKQALLQTTVAAAKALTESRLKAFEQLKDKLQQTLAYLNMSGVEFSLHRTSGALTSIGQDNLEFYIVTNKGEQPKPLSRIASGGELSRIMLAMKNAMADSDSLQSVIYDEIDTGVSGMAAGRIGRVLQQTSDRGRQVICVTHTAQIAACADSHLYIEKATQNDRTFTYVRQLDAEARVKELARITSGSFLTETALAGAAEMVQHFSRREDYLPEE